MSNFLLPPGTPSASATVVEISCAPTNGTATIGDEGARSSNPSADMYDIEHRE